jgi:hypothetical protein
MPAGQDGCHWIANAQRVAFGEWRPRFTMADNAPEGRAIHWSGSVAWWLALCGSAAAVVKRTPAPAEIELAALWAMPLAQGILIIAIPLFCRRHFGNVAAACLALGMGCTYSFASLFFAAAPDHHGLVASALLCMVLLAVIARGGWSLEPGFQGTRILAWSGFAAGVAMWISAATALPCLAALLLAAGIGSLLPRNPRWHFHPGAWRIWGVTAGVTCMAFYLLEYFPANMELRLEVIHPLYALSLAAAGEIIHQAGKMRNGIRPSSVSWLWVVFVFVALLAPGIALLATGTDSFRVFDPMLWQLHQENIHEFAPFLLWASSQPPQALAIYLSPLPILGIIAVLLLWKFRSETGVVSEILLALLPAILLTILGFGQVRWMTTSGVMWLAPLTVVAAFLSRPAYPDSGFPRLGGVPLVLGRLTLGAVLLTILWVLPSRVVQDTIATLRGQAGLTAGDSQCLYMREIAYRIRALAGGHPAVIASSPTASTWLSYFGGHQTLGTLYWENLAGLVANAKIYAAMTEMEVLELLRERRVDFIAFFAFEPFESVYPKLIGTKRDGSTPIVTQLSRAQIEPSWARFVPMPRFAEVQTTSVLLFDVRPARRMMSPTAQPPRPPSPSASSSP